MESQDSIKSIKIRSGTRKYFTLTFWRFWFKGLNVVSTFEVDIDLDK